MLFADRIKELREKKQMVQRQFAAALETDTPMYSKIERGERRAKKEQIPIIAEILQTDPEELLALWLANQVSAVVADEHKVADKALSIAKQNFKN
ncbi:MAG: helix-turn-helix domain-containing protein [Prevotellaceae bacterium]|jgi:transcriptional regulator with XRE-family HTH domain|nr:helix-turn-helix domain-containing protein [Prevotellaceae bacterium]